MPQPYRGNVYICNDRVTEKYDPKLHKTVYTLVQEGCGRKQIHQGPCYFCGNATEQTFQ